MLSRAPTNISVAELVGRGRRPISLADCLDGPSGTCGLESFCSVRGPWRKITDAIRGALDEVTLADMTQAGGDAGREGAMSGRLETAQAVEALAGERYKYGFVTDVETESAPPRPRRRDDPLHLRQEARARLASRLAPQGLRALASGR